MGTKVGPNYANVFVGFVEKLQIFEHYTGPSPDNFGRYIDDCLGKATNIHHLDTLRDSVSSTPRLNQTLLAS